MANEGITNAAALMMDDTFYHWTMAGVVYHSAIVVREAPQDYPDHDARLRLAVTTITGPELVARKSVNLIATDAEVFSRGSTPAAVGQDMLLLKIAQLWSAFASLP